MSMISELVDRLRIESKSMGKYGTDYMATLLMRAADTIVLLSEKAREPKQGEWIPCSERLPAKAGHYLCSFKKANRIDNIYVDLAYWTGGRWYGYLANEINAWMPLPKPWKGADDE